MPWQNIDVEDIEMECKQFTRDMRLLDKIVRKWPPYLHITVILKNWSASLRSITELQNSAIKAHHWMELMHITKVRNIFYFPYNVIKSFQSFFFYRLATIIRRIIW